MMTNKNHTVIYTGVTSKLTIRRMEHISKEHLNSFSAKYNCDKLVYFKWYSRIEDAIAEEKRIKGGAPACKS